MSQRPLASSRRAATPPSPRSATRASPAPLPSSSSSITRSTTPSQRAHSWCQQIVQLWEKRHSQTGAAHAAEVSQQIARAAQGVLAAAGASTTATTSQVAVSVLHQHAHDLLRVTQEAVEMWLKSSASKVDASSASSSPAISNSTDDASSSVAAPPATFALAPAALQLLLRLIVLLCQCLPAHYSKAWSAANPLPPALNSDDFAGGVEKPTPLAKKPIPIPRGLEVSTFQAWFLRVHHLGFSLVDEVLREGRRRIAWDARFGALGVHLAVLARFHAPTAVEGEMTNAQFWSRFEEHILAHAWFASNLTQYEGLRDLLQSMVTLLVTDGDSARLRRIAMQILRSFRSDPIPFPPASASSSSSSSSTLASTRTHLIQSGVKRTPPGLVQHEGVMSFLGMTVQAAGEMEKNEAKPEQSTSSPPSTTETFLLALLQELHEQFHLATAASESKLFHRSSMPVFGVIGLLQAIDGDATPAATNDSVDKPLAVVLEKARAELRSMLAALFNTPDVQSLYSHLRSLSPCHPTLSFGQPWPCTNSLGVCCNSCLFTIVVTTACVQGAKWIPNDDNITAASRRGPSQLARPPAHPKPSLLLISTTLVAHTFLHLIDTTWVLNGSIELAEELPMAATDGSSSQASDRSTAGAGASRPPPNPSAPSSPPRLLAWLSSPLYALLPHYTRAFSLLFLHLQSREEQQRLLGHVWRRVKYVHCVWRWYRTDGGGAGSVPLSSGATTFAAGDLTASGLKEAVERAKQAASEINEAPKTVKLPVSPALAPSPRSVRVSSTPIRLHRTTLRRAHSGCYLSLLMFLGAILRDARWRGAVAQEGENEVDDEEGRVTLAAASKQQAFSIAIIIDILSHLEFLASTVTVASGASNPSVSAAGGPQPGRNGFGPYKEVLEIVLALVTGREIRDAASSPSQSASLVEPSPNELVRRAHRAMLYRDAFARETMSMFIRCFFKPQSGEDEAKSVLLSPTLGLESAGSHLVKASKLPQFVALPYLLAASGLPFAPTILSHPSLQLPDPLTTPWPALTSKLTIAPPSSGSNSPGSFDAVTASRQYFLAGVFSGTASLLPFSMSFHYLLPFLFHLSTSQGERLRGLKKRGLQGLCGLVKRGFRVATMGVQENEEDDSSQMFPGLPLAPSGADLERFLRQLLPFLTSHVLASFPHYAGFQQVLEVYLCVFACVPGNDVLLLHSLQTLLTKSSSILVGLMENEARLKRWKQVTELAGRTRQDEGEDEDKEEDDAVEDDFQVYDLPQNVRLPQKFPSLTSVRKLLLLHLQLMQSLDGTLYPRALAQLDHLFTHTLSPSLHPVATPLRSSLAAMLHESLVRGFDLSKRDATAEWFIRMEERLNIPVGIQAPATPPQSLLPSGSSSSSHSSLIDAVKKAEASRPGRMVRANGTAGRSTARGSDALTRRPAEVVPPAPRLVCVEENPGPVYSATGPTFADRALLMMRRAFASVTPSGGPPQQQQAGGSHNLTLLEQQQMEQQQYKRGQSSSGHSRTQLQSEMKYNYQLPAVHPLLFPPPDRVAALQALAASATTYPAMPPPLPYTAGLHPQQQRLHPLHLRNAGSKRHKRPLTQMLMKKLETAQAQREERKEPPPPPIATAAAAAVASVTRHITPSVAAQRPPASVAVPAMKATPPAAVAQPKQRPVDEMKEPIRPHERVPEPEKPELETPPTIAVSARSTVSARPRDAALKATAAKRARSPSPETSEALEEQSNKKVRERSPKPAATRRRSVSPSTKPKPVEVRKRSASPMAKSIENRRRSPSPTEKRAKVDPPTAAAAAKSTAVSAKPAAMAPSSPPREDSPPPRPHSGWPKGKPRNPKKAAEWLLAHAETEKESSSTSSSAAAPSSPVVKSSKRSESTKGQSALLKKDQPAKKKPFAPPSSSEDEESEVSQKLPSRLNGKFVSSNALSSPALAPSSSSPQRSNAAAAAAALAVSAAASSPRTFASKRQQRSFPARSAASAASSSAAPSSRSPSTNQATPQHASSSPTVLPKRLWKERHSAELSELAEKGFEHVPTEDEDVAVVNIISRDGAKSHLVRMDCVDEEKREAFYRSGRPSLYTSAAHFRDAESVYYCRCTRHSVNNAYYILQHIDLRHPCEIYREEGEDFLPIARRKREPVQTEKEIREQKEKEARERKQKATAAQVAAATATSSKSKSSSSSSQRDRKRQRPSSAADFHAKKKSKQHHRLPPTVQVPIQDASELLNLAPPAAAYADESTTMDEEVDSEERKSDRSSTPASAVAASTAVPAAAAFTSAESELQRWKATFGVLSSSSTTTPAAARRAVEQDVKDRILERIQPLLLKGLIAGKVWQAIMQQ